MSLSTAREWGLVNRVVAAEQLLDDAVELAEQISALDPDFVRDYRELMDRGYDLPLREALEREQLYARVYNHDVSAADLEQRRAGVMAKGRSRQ